MRRDLYTSEYERVRRRAGLGRTEFFDPDEPPTPAERAAVEAMRADAAARLQEDALAAVERRAAAQASLDALRRRTNERLMRAGWERYGLAPPDPLCSLELMLSVGWRLRCYTLNGADRWELEPPVRAQSEPWADGRGQQT